MFCAAQAGRQGGWAGWAPAGSAPVRDVAKDVAGAAATAVRKLLRFMVMAGPSFPNWLSIGSDAGGDVKGHALIC